MIALAAVPCATAASYFTDSAGRHVEVPDKVERVLAAGPPAALALYSVAPDKLIGWPHGLDKATAALLPQRYALLPVTARITGHANAPTTEAILALHPDLIVGIGDVEPEYAELADRIQQQTHIAYVLLDGRLANTAAVYRSLGALLGEHDKAEELAAYAEQVFTRLPPPLTGMTPAVYYARGSAGLLTGADTSLTGDIIHGAGGRNVAAGSKSVMKVSIDQVASWHPDAIVTQDPAIYRIVMADPAWAALAAVRNKRVYLSPQAPFGWVDEPPGINRLLGVQWLASRLRPDAGIGDLTSHNPGILPALLSHGAERGPTRPILSTAHQTSNQQRRLR